MRRPGRRGDRVFELNDRNDVDEELAMHVEERVRYYMERGLDEATARRAALDRLGDLEAVRSRCADLERSARRVSWLRRWLGDLRRDAAFGLRSAARAPVLTAMAIITLALGTGANGAVFGVVKSVLLDGMPYEEDERLVRVYERAVEDPGERSPLSAGAVRDYRERQRSFERMAVFYPIEWEAIWRSGDSPRSVRAAYIEAGFLEMLGVRPAAGRWFREDEVEAGEKVVLVSDALWRHELGGDSTVIGQTVRIDADTWTVIGVLPAGFTGPMGDADVWFAIGGLARSESARQRRSLGLIGRLRRGATVESAAADLGAISGELAREHPATDGGRTVTVVSLRDSMVGDTRMALLVLMGSAAIVLLIACANLSGALLSRSITRRGEFAVRLAMGAGRGRLVRQLLTESLLLGVAGAGLGVAVAAGALTVLRRAAPASLPPWVDLSLDTGAFAIMALVAVGTGLLIGVVPALSVRRTNPQQALSESGRGSVDSVRTRQVRGILVAGQVALCLSLLAGAGLLGRSLIAMTAASPGYDPDSVLTVSVKGPVPASDAARRQFFEQLGERMASLPGVVGVALTSQLPGPAMTRADIVVEGDPATRDAPASVPVTVVSDDYFATMRIPLLEGRTFGVEDGPESAPAVIVSERLARRYWPGGGALGARIRIGPASEDPMGIVVGVVADVRNDPALELPESMVYTASRQSQLRGIFTYVLRTAGDPLSFVGPFRENLESIDASVPVDDALTLRSLRDAHISPRRLPALMLAVFAALALLLASVGVHALFTALAVSRRREFGIRLALGATPATLAGLLLRHGAVWMFAGLAGGAIGAAAIARALRGLLYGVAPLDPLSIAFAFAALLGFAALALAVPLRRVIRTDPRAAMR